MSRFQYQMEEISSEPRARHYAFNTAIPVDHAPSYHPLPRPYHPPRQYGPPPQYEAPPHHSHDGPHYGPPVRAGYSRSGPLMRNQPPLYLPPASSMSPLLKDNKILTMFGRSIPRPDTTNHTFRMEIPNVPARTALQWHKHHLSLHIGRLTRHNRHHRS